MTRRIVSVLLALFGLIAVTAACTPDQIAYWNTLSHEQQLAVGDAVHAAANPQPSGCVEAMHAVWPQHLWGWAERKIDAESGGSPSAQNKSSSAAGCFQIIKGTWESNAACDWSARYNAMCNVKTAWILYQRAGTSPWAASGG